ncbi:MAG TPA: two-component regulator propeller domain-containing protein [Blastocatellia bacterium]|nr:two-component regulator propeller domain-containing protein [Blastocatellia bacterium]
MRIPSSRFIILAVAFVCVMLSLAAHRRAQALSAEKPLAQYSHSVWRTENGLPQNTVRAIVQTRDGYIWLATDDGLVRFDGIRLTVFDRQNTPAMKSSVILTLYEDQAGVLWVGTDGGLLKYQNDGFVAFTTKDGLANDRVTAVTSDREGRLWIATPGGLSRFDAGRFVTYTTDKGLPSDSVGALYGDSHGDLWAGTTGGLARFSGEQITEYTMRDGLPRNGINAIYEDRDGNLWCATPGGLARFNNGRFVALTTADGLASNMVWAMRQDREGALWVGTDGGLSRLTKAGIKTFTTADGLANNSVYSILEDHDGNLWLGTPGGLSRMQAGRLSAYTARDGLSSNGVLAMLEDREGNLWVGTESGGLNLFRDKKFTNLTASDGLASDLAWAVREARDGALWVGTQAGLSEFRNGAFKTYTTKDGLPSDIVRALCEDRTGQLWVGTPAGLCRFANGRFTTFTDLDGLSSNAVSVIEEGADGSLWIGTLAGLTRLKDGRFTVYTTQSGLSNDAILSLRAARDGGLWIGTRNGGLNRFKDDRFTAYTAEQGLSDASVRALYEDQSGTLWVGTRSGGLNRFKDGRFVPITARNGLADDGIFQILEDGKGNLWMSGTKGVFAASREQLNAFAEKSIADVSSITYGTADGMESRECTGGGQPAGWRSRDGRLWFPTIKGVAVVDPEHMKTNAEPPPVVIEQVIVDDKPVAKTANIELPAGVYRLEFHYTGLSFIAPEKVRFKYKLEGFDQNWVDAGARRIAYYTSIPPGHYTFHVLAANNDGVWNGAGAVVSFYLQPRFYQTIWFYVALLAIAAAVSWAIYRRRIRRVRAEFAAVLAERNRMARDIHDTLAQGFVGISLQLEAVGKMLDQSPDRAKQHLDLAQTMVTHSLTEARRSVWDLRAQALENADLAAALADAAKKLTSGTTVQAEFNVKGTPRPLPATVENNLWRIGQEAMTNAMKHARPRHLRVELSFAPKQVTLSVADDGRGFDTQNDRLSGDGHFGLIGMRERAERLKGKLQIDSGAGTGTRISVTAPVD